MSPIYSLFTPKYEDWNSKGVAFFFFVPIEKSLDYLGVGREQKIKKVGNPNMTKN